MSNTRKTQRKNKTNQVINWPSADNYFTIDSLTKTNEHMLTGGKGSDITLRVRLMKHVKGDGTPKTVDAIGTFNTGKGRPQLVFAMRPVTQSALDKAKKDNVMLSNQSELVPVMDIKKKSSTPVVEPVKITSTQTVTA